MPTNSDEKQKIFYSEDAPLIISELMKKYGLRETSEEFFEKLEKNERINGEKIAEIIVRLTENKITFNDLTLEIQKNLSVSENIAGKLTNDIKKKILLSSQKTTKKQTIPKEKRKITSTENFVILKKDVYREPIE